MGKNFKEELLALISECEDSILAKYIDECLKKYEHENYTSQLSKPSTNHFGVDLNKVPEVKTETPQTPQPIPANVGNNKVTTGWSNPFGGTSWGA
jgi:hypothetical protein